MVLLMQQMELYHWTNWENVLYCLHPLLAVQDKWSNYIRMPWQLSDMEVCNIFHIFSCILP